MKRPEITEYLYDRLNEVREGGLRPNDLYKSGQLTGYLEALDLLDAVGAFRMKLAAIDHELQVSIAESDPYVTDEYRKATVGGRMAYEMGYVHALQIAQLLVRKPR